MKKKKEIEIISGRCAARYPILMVHGLGFRDNKIYRYWGRIPRKLAENGAKVFYGGTDAWGTIDANAAKLAERINEVLGETGAEKVNIIAHSKGGIDARRAICLPGMAAKAASLSTVSSPHHGSKSLKVYCKFPWWLRKFIALFPNLWFRILGDEKPDFYAVTQSLTTTAMEKFNAENPDAEGVYYQSFAALMSRWRSDFFMIIPYLAIKLIEGSNDGMVTPRSAAWTNFRGIIHSPTSRGVSHGDSVDFRRRRITKKKADGKYSDITDFYIELAEGLKNEGL